MEKLYDDRVEQQIGAEEVPGSMPSFEEYIMEQIKPEVWTDFPEDTEGIDGRPDVDGAPQTLWRGERLYLSNIDELGRRNITTVGHEAKRNRNGETFCARDKKYASLYAVGTDGVTWYDGELPKEQIPIGVVYRIENTGNNLGALPTDDEPEFFGPFAGKFREFVLKTEIPTGQYSVEEIYIMDDFDQPGGHRRSDFRRPKEVYKVRDQKYLPYIVEAVKRRMDELDKKRHLSSR